MDFFSNWHVAQGLWTFLAILGLAGGGIGLFLFIEGIFKEDK